MLDWGFRGGREEVSSRLAWEQEFKLAGLNLIS
jgi:hypothetical protein